MIPLYPVGLADPTLAPVKYYVETKVANLRQADKRKRVEWLKRANSSESFEATSWDQCRLRPQVRKQLFSHNPALQVLCDIASSPFTRMVLS